MADFKTLEAIYQNDPRARAGIKKILEVAAREVGYGVTIKSGDQWASPTKFGEYIDDNHYYGLTRDKQFYNSSKRNIQWCALFVDYCYLKAFGFDITKKITNQGGPSNTCGAAVSYSVKYFKDMDRYISKSGHNSVRDFIAPGCEVFFDWNADGSGNHAALVYAIIDNKNILTVEGNTGWQNVGNLSKYGVPQDIVSGISNGTIYPGSGKTSRCVSFKKRSISNILGVGFPKYEESDSVYSTVYIGSSNGPKESMPYIYSDNAWRAASPYILTRNPNTNELEWTSCGSSVVDFSSVDGTGGVLVQRSLSRNGKYYYGTPYSRNKQQDVYTNGDPSTSQKEVNARFVYDYFKAKGWTKQAIGALLGNMQKESLLNPGLWEGGTPATNRGFGLVQWTNSTVYTDWAKAEGLSTSEYSDIFYQCEKIMCEMEPYDHYVNEYGKQYSIRDTNVQFFYDSGIYNRYSWNLNNATRSQCKEINRLTKFSKSTYSPEILSDIFITNYLRPASSSTAGTRAKCSRDWYNFIKNL